MVPYWNEYKSSLKNIHVEEMLDVYLYRPIAFIIVKLFYSFPITPNHFSLMALAAGCLSAYFCAQGTTLGFIFGAINMAAFGVLDCCDGMLARLKRNGTELGRIIDGLVDYTVNVLIYIGLGVGLSKSDLSLPMPVWIYVLLAGLSKAFHAIIFDNYLYEYLSHVSGKHDHVAMEIAKCEEALKRAEEEKGNYFYKFSFRTYLFFLHLQTLSKKNNEAQAPSVMDSQKYLENNIWVLKLWGLIGPSAHITAFVVAFLLQRPMLLFFYSVIWANLWMVVMMAIQNQTNQKCKLKSKLEKGSGRL